MPTYCWFNPLEQIYIKNVQHFHTTKLIRKWNVLCKMAAILTDVLKPICLPVTHVLLQSIIMSPQLVNTGRNIIFSDNDFIRLISFSGGMAVNIILFLFIQLWIQLKISQYPYRCFGRLKYTCTCRQEYYRYLHHARIMAEYILLARNCHEKIRYFNIQTSARLWDKLILVWGHRLLSIIYCLQWWRIDKYDRIHELN